MINKIFIMKYNNDHPEKNSEFITVHKRKILFLLTLIPIVFGAQLLWFSLLNEPQVQRIYLDLTNGLSHVHTTSDKFLSFGIDTSLLRNTRYFPVKDERFLNLARLLSPAYVRIGGTASDCLYFNRTVPKPTNTYKPKYDPHNITKFFINGEDLISLYEFSKKANLRMIFDLNVLIRHVNNTWDSSNAEEIIKFTKEHEFESDWQLGNEPNSFRHVFHRVVSAPQLAEDYKILRKILDENKYKDSSIFGPETNHIGDSINKGIQYAKEFFVNSDDSVNLLTWHQYYLNGREAKVDDFINLTVFNYLPSQIDAFNQIFDGTNKSVPTCLSETSTAYGGGAPELSDRFVAGFLWLDKLGYSASTGMKVVIRQSFYGGHYAMVGPDLKPNPDWWISLIYKMLVSEKVLKFGKKDLDPSVRLYAHCSSRNLNVNTTAITVFGMNLKHSESFNIDIETGGIEKKHVYVFTADNLQSREIRLNGVILNSKSYETLPLVFNPRIYSENEVITVPPLSMFFIVVFQTKNTICI